MSNDKSYSERVSFRLRDDQLEWVDKLVEEEKGPARRSSVLRQIVDVHRAIMTSSLSQLLEGSPVADVSQAIPKPDEDGE